MSEVRQATRTPGQPAALVVGAVFLLVGVAGLIGLGLVPGRSAGAPRVPRG